MDSLGILACLIVLALIILSKAYKRIVFRLVLYFIIADIFQAITHIIELTPLEYVNGNVVVKEGAEGLCAFYGFLDQIALWMSNVAVIWIMLYLLWIANKLRKVHRDGNPYKNKISIKTELVGLFFLIVFPFTFNWIPFIWNMYGISGLWCWIKESRDYCHDYNFGLTLIFSMFYSPLIIIVTFTFISLIAITVILCKGALNKDGVAKKNVHSLRQKHHPYCHLSTCVHPDLPSAHHTSHLLFYKWFSWWGAFLSSLGCTYRC